MPTMFKKGKQVVVETESFIQTQNWDKYDNLIGCKTEYKKGYQPIGEIKLVAGNENYSGIGGNIKITATRQTSG